jgi:ABC-type sugar transport system ATPase subunit
LDPSRLIALMVGREAGAAAAAPSAVKGAVALAVRGLGRAGKFREVSFEVRQGEVLGLAGLMGAGRTDVINALFGLAPPDSGEVRVQGRSVRFASPRDALRFGLGLVSEDRREYGLVHTLSVKQNLTLASLCQCCWGWFIGPAREDRVAGEQVRDYAIRAPDRDAPVSCLSGGNQQKVVIAKSLLAAPAILLLDEPTRGMDIAAKTEVHAIISRLAQQGKAMVLVSSELPELLSLSDRLLVLCEGRVTAELDPRRCTPAEVMKWAMPGYQP